MKKKRRQLNRSVTRTSFYDHLEKLHAKLETLKALESSHMAVARPDYVYIKELGKKISMVRGHIRSTSDDSV